LTRLVVSLSPLPSAFISSLLAPYADKVGGIKVVSRIEVSEEELKEALRQAEAVIGDYSFQFRITRDICNLMEKARVIAQPSTGYDHIDIEACREKGIPVTNAGGANSISVAEWTVMAALILLKRALYAHFETKKGGWPQWELMDMGTYDLYGKTWGIIGLGRIGREVAKRVRAFGAKIVYYDKYRHPKEAEEELGVEYAPLSKLIRVSDVISIHVPLTPETRHLIGERELRVMKPTAILINPSRGEIVDEEALARALEEGWIMGAAVDVYSREPPGPDHPLIKLEHTNLLTTPHIAGANSDARARIIQVVVENVIRALSGQPLKYVVNM
jgi:phosphoglycerate dehydrogenase-like enzyme